MKFFNCVGPVKVRCEPKHIDKDKVDVFAIIFVSFTIYTITLKSLISCNCVQFSSTSKHSVRVPLYINKLYS
jgi:hypothetical protein